MDRPGVPHYGDGRWRCYEERRDLSAIKYLVLHQWGAHASLVRQRGESLEDCAIRRARSTVYTADVFEGDVIVWAWDPSIVAWSSNGWNRTSVSLSVGGLFPRYEAKRTSAHSDLHDFEAGLVRALEMMAARFPGITLVTHCQSSKHRLADPGEALARVAVREAQRLGLPVDFDMVLGTGHPTPLEWRTPWEAAPPTSASQGRAYSGPEAVSDRE